MEYTAKSLWNHLAELDCPEIWIPEGIPESRAYIMHGANTHGLSGYNRYDAILITSNAGLRRLQAFCKKYNIKVYG